MNTIMKNRLLAPMNLLYKFYPQKVLEVMYRLKTGDTLNLDKPVKYTEKIQWIKLYYKNELMPKCCDKLLVREYVKSCGCGEILNELIWEGFNPEDIPFDELPNEYVIKITHGSDFNIICKNKQEINQKKTVKLLKKWLKTKFLPCYGEWFYHVEKPKIIIEKYLIDESANALFDYKVFCFNGKPRFIYVSLLEDIDGGNVYDLDFNFLENIKMGDEHELKTEVPRPRDLNKLLEYARKLSNDFLHVRVDFYEVNGKVVFGELTFTNGSGFTKIKPREFNVKMGNWLCLPNLE